MSSNIIQIQLNKTRIYINTIIQQQEEMKKTIINLEILISSLQQKLENKQNNIQPEKSTRIAGNNVLGLRLNKLGNKISIIENAINIDNSCNEYDDDEEEYEI